jgi:RNA polymerase sigma-70 factor (sigma-E family)
MSRRDELTPPSRDEMVALLWQQHHVRLVRLAAGLTGDMGAAEEIVQDAFTTLLGRWRLLRDPAAGHAYLQRVVINAARRRWQRRQFLDRVSTLVARPAPADDRDIALQLDLLAALARLPYSKRACLLLRYYADLSQAEVAQVMGVSLGTVKSQTAKGLRQLAAVLDETPSEIR